jgi:hypothetical protein
MICHHSNGQPYPCMFQSPWQLTIFISIPLVYDHACWKYSSNLCRNGFGIWWKRMNSLIRIIWIWYLDVPEYSLWMMAETLPKILAYINAERYNKKLWKKWHSSMTKNTINKKLPKILAYINAEKWKIQGFKLFVYICIVIGDPNIKEAGLGSH